MPVLFSLTVEYNNTPTNPYFIVNHGDGSPIPNPATLMPGKNRIDHFYDHAGIYNVNVKVFNKVSSQEKQMTVKILNRFLDFKCLLNWRLLDLDGLQETQYLMDPDTKMYTVSSSHDLRFHCTWKSECRKRLV